MAGRVAFMKQASVSGWCWLVEITNHVGAIAILLAVLGISAFSGWKLPHWWLGALILLAFAVVLFGEGAYRVWAKTETSLAEANARLGTLDSDSAKRSYLDRRVGEARGFVEEYAELTDEEWYDENPRITEDLVHWENEVRSDIREKWGTEAARKFDLDPETKRTDVFRNRETREGLTAYVERRIARLTELRNET